MADVRYGKFALNGCTFGPTNMVCLTALDDNATFFTLTAAKSPYLVWQHLCQSCEIFYLEVICRPGNLLLWYVLWRFDVKWVSSSA